MAALAVAQQVARAAYLHIAHRHAEARAEFSELSDGSQALVGVFREHLARLHGQIGIGQAVAAPHAAADLIQLRQAEAIRVDHDQRVGARHVQPRLYNRGTQQHVVFALVEIEHHVLEGVLAHLAMTNRHARLGHQPPQPLVKALDRLHAVIEHIHLSVAPQLAQYRIADQLVGILHDVVLHGIAFLGRRAQERHIAYAHHGHMQRARYRRGGERQHVHVLLELLDRFLMLDAEALLLVDDEQTQIGIAHIAAQQAVRAHDDVHRAGFDVLDGRPLLGARAETAEHIHADGIAGKALQYRLIVLLDEYGRRREQHGLLALHDALEDRPQRHFRLAVAHIAAQKAIHRARLLHVALDLSDGAQLVVGFLIGEFVLKFALPGRIGREGEALRIVPLGIELHQILGDFVDVRLDARLLLLPFAAGKLVELGRRVLGADILLHAVELIGGHIQPVAALIADEQIIVVNAVGLYALGAHVLADAVVFMHHEIAGLEIGERLQLLARLP